MSDVSGGGLTGDLADAVHGKLSGEIFPKFFRVSYEEATNRGFEPANMKYFGLHEHARKYAQKLVKDDLEQSAEETDDYEAVTIEDEAGEIVEAWRAEDGKVVHYPKGW